jgi:hypothetical protein
VCETDKIKLHCKKCTLATLQRHIFTQLLNINSLAHVEIGTKNFAFVHLLGAVDSVQKILHSVLII